MHFGSETRCRCRCRDQRDLIEQFMCSSVTRNSSGVANFYEYEYDAKKLQDVARVFVTPTTAVRVKCISARSAAGEESS